MPPVVMVVQRLLYNFYNSSKLYVPGRILLAISTVYYLVASSSWYLVELLFGFLEPGETCGEPIISFSSN